MRRLVSAGLLPERAGQPVKAVVHISLADLMVLEGSSALLEEWTARVRAQWAGHRARGNAGEDGDGACPDSDDAGLDGPGTTNGQDGTGCGPGAAAPGTTLAWEALERAIIGKTILLSLHSLSRLDLR